MIVCENCKSQEPNGAVFCSECGAQLFQINPDQTHEFDIEPEGVLRVPSTEEQAPKQVISRVSLHLLESGIILDFSERSEYTLGRLSENQPIEPDIDLSPYKAFDNGVSRLHAVIKQSAAKVVLVDLGSSNGTYINGLRIPPHVDYSMQHGDILALGKLKMQLLLH